MHTCHGAGLSAASAAQPARFTIHTFDEFDNARARGGEHITVELRTASGGVVPGGIADHDNGTYSASFVPLAQGVHELHVKVKQEAIALSPYTVQVYAGATEPSRCILTGHSFRRVEIMRSAGFLVTLVDGAGNVQKDSDDHVNVSFTDRGTGSQVDAQPPTRRNKPRFESSFNSRLIVV